MNNTSPINNDMGEVLTSQISSILARTDISGGEKTVYIAVLLECGPRESAFCSIDYLASMAGLSRDRTRHILCDLVTKGLLLRKQQPGMVNEWIIPSASYPDVGMVPSERERSRVVPFRSRQSKKKRLFNKIERYLLAERSGWKCNLCGCDLRDNWHADHIIPRSKGGETVMDNGQALCPDCNIKKNNSLSD